LQNHFPKDIPKNFSKKPWPQTVEEKILLWKSDGYNTF
jgi:hypothetical protein